MTALITCDKISKNVNIMVKLKRHVSKATLVSLYYSLIYPYLTCACTLWGNNYNAPVSQIVKLQNKAVRGINDVPLMEPITPHYLSLHLLKFPDIVKLNTCMLFYDYFHHEKFPNIPVSLVSELHNYNTRIASSNQIFIPSFRTNLRRFCPTIIGCFFWNNIPEFIRDKPSKKLFRKALLHWYLAQYIILFCFNKNLKSFCNLKGHNISLSKCAPLLSFQYTMSNNLSCCYLYCLFVYLFICLFLFIYFSFLKPIST